MGKQADHISHYINENLLPILAKDGFQRIKSKEFIRVSEHFIDNISFQLSQHGSKNFHVHYSTKLLADPLLEMEGYTLGYRLSNNNDNGDLTKWCGSSDSEAQAAISSVANAYENTISPWFTSVNTIPGYIFESLVKHKDISTKTLDFAVAFATAGKRSRAWWICSDIINSESTNNPETINACQEYIDTDEVEKRKEALQDEKYAKFNEALADMPLPNTEYDSISSLLENWKIKNIERYKLDKYIS